MQVTELSLRIAVRRPLMVFQAFVDDSYTDDASYALAGYVAEAELECAPDGGQIAGWELTEAVGLSEDGSHGQAPHPQR